MRRIAIFLSYILVFSIPWEDAISLNILGSMARILGIITAVFWFLNAYLRKKLRRPQIFHILFFFFITWNLLSYFWSASPDHTEARIKTYIQLALLSWIFWDLYITHKAVRTALQVYVLGAFVSIGSTIINFSRGQAINVNTIRYSASGVNAVDLSLILSLGLPIAWYLATTAKHGLLGLLSRLINFGYLPAGLFAIILTGSRTSLFLVIPVVLYILGTTNRLKPLWQIVILVALIGSLISLQDYLPQAIFDRLASAPTSIASGDFGGRVPLWRASIRTFSEHPVLGIGSGSLNSSFQLGSAAHNTFISILAETGIVGFIIFCSLYGATLLAAIRQPRPLSRLWLTILAVWSIGVLSLTWEFRKPTWFFLSLIIISANCREDFSEQQGDSELNGVPGVSDRIIGEHIASTR